MLIRSAREKSLKTKGPFYPLKIEVVPCEMGTAAQHLDAFIHSFICAPNRSRVQHIVTRLAPKQPDRLGALHKLLDHRFTSPPKAFALPSNLPNIGVYFAGGKSAWILSLADAEIVSVYLGQDVIWSAVPGVYGAFLHHESLRWICFRAKLPVRGVAERGAAADRGNR